MRRLITAVASLGLFAAAPAPLRVGVVSAVPGPCAAPGASAPQGERAYFALLTTRLDREVVACPMTDAHAAAAALAVRTLDMAVLDRTSWPVARTVARATMTMRSQGGLARVPVFLMVKAGHGADPGSLKGSVIVFAGASQAAFLLPQAVLAQQGYGPGIFGRYLVAHDEISAMTMLRSGQAGAIALHAAAWQRQCETLNNKDPCADLKVIWEARPQAERALVVRRDLPDPLRYRLLGVHLAMHMEDRAAFAWAARQFGPGAADFQPAEAGALETARLR